MTAADAVGGFGVTILLIGFLLNSRGVLPSDGIAYQGLNALGSAIAGIASWWIEYIPFVVLEVTWCSAALWNIGRKLRLGRGSNA